MRRALLGSLRDPRTKEALELLELRSGAPRPSDSADVLEGILRSSGAAYPIVDGVPVMLDRAFPKSFLELHAARIAAEPGLARLCVAGADTERWSFSNEWDEHFARGANRTWGWTLDERIELFLMETQVAREACRNLRVLDAGCGNGALAEGISTLGAEVVGLDLSSAVRSAERRRTSPAVHFVRGDLLRPPFEPESFDLVISIGVLHHTPDARRAFAEIATLVKPGGKLYVWLYRRPEAFLQRYLKHPAFALARGVVSRLPAGLQRLCVTAYAHTVRGFHRFKGPYGEIPFPEYLVAAYDDLTPRWRSDHTPWEACDWLFRCGFSAPVISHWDNPHGFGVVATRSPQLATPGIHYGDAPKLWDSRKSLERLRKNRASGGITPPI